MNNNGHEDDLIAEGFVQLDERYLSRRPPHIKWGVKFESWSDAEKIDYLKGLAQTMNHAASLVQDERDQLNEVCEKKEALLVKAALDLQANNTMLQQQITEMNALRQGYHAHVAELNKQIKALSNGD